MTDVSTHPLIEHETMVEVAICSDDEHAIELYSRIMQLSATQCGRSIDIHAFRSCDALLPTLCNAEAMPAIVILDVGSSCTPTMEVAEKLQDGVYGGVVIFLSETTDAALDAFDVGAFNYVIKSSGDTDSRFASVFTRALEGAHRKRKTILLNGVNEHRNVALSRISYFEVRKHVVTVHYDGSCTFDFVSTLDRVENLLPAYGFIRTQRSFIVNAEKVQRYDSKKIELSDGTTVPLGRKYRDSFRNMMESVAMRSL